jgi:hypothetical protein
MRKLLLAGIAATAFGAAAQASPVPFALTPLTSATALGPMTVVFVFQNAADESTLSWDQGAGAAAIVDNQNDPVGTTALNFGAAGSVTFTLENLSPPNVFTFTLGTAVDDGDGNLIQHFQGSTNFADFGVGALSAAAQAAVTAAGPGGIFVGVEDRIGGDYDFNDLIYYFRSVRTDVEVPAPAALGLFGLGLLGLAALRRRG